MSSTKNLTPMLSQYLDIKEQYQDAILFYRMGDFYEMFFDDAVRASPILEVQLTSRDRNSPEPVPMCGVPHHSAASYIQKLLSQGFKVAICEQMEDPAMAKGLVRREVVRVLTPALIGDPDIVPDEVSNYLACLCERPKGEIEICFFDLLGGQTRFGVEASWRLVTDLFLQFCPKEWLVPEGLREKKWFQELSKVFPQAVVTERRGYFLPDQTQSGCRGSAVFGALSRYLQETQKTNAILSLSEPISLTSKQVMSLDSTTLRSLEILKGDTVYSEGHSLLGVLNFTLTPMGRRKLKDWLAHPLCSSKEIKNRLDCVRLLVSDPALSAHIKDLLSNIRDLERLAIKTSLGLSMPRDLLLIRETLMIIPVLKDLLHSLPAELFFKESEKLNPVMELTSVLDRALLDELPATMKEGGIFKEKYHEQIGELRHLALDARSTIAAMEMEEREKTGIPNLKIKFNRVFGYSIEITKSYQDRVPDRYIRRQTLANAERYLTKELQAFEEKVISAEQKLKALEESLFLKLRAHTASFSEVLLVNASILAELDVLFSFSEAAKQRGYREPEIIDGDELEIIEGRHPVIETLMPPGGFVPNSVSLSSDKCQTLVITGPNMAGKSTIMRQVALIAVMAQAGSFVPAQRAKISCLDAIFTRIGSSDDLTHGRSTFMVEMTEVVRILNHATKKSLVLIDEIGRGTSTYDGLALAWSLLEHLHVSVQAKTLFATHFHEITALEKHLLHLKNVNVLVEKWNDEIVFLHKLGPGICNRSYGVEVARLAGLPAGVLSRAKEILGVLESQSQRGSKGRSRALEVHDNQLDFFN